MDLHQSVQKIPLLQQNHNAKQRQYAKRIDSQ